MNLKRIKYMIFILCVIVVIIIAIIFLIKNNGNDQLTTNMEQGKLKTETTPKNVIVEVTDRESFYAIKSCLNKFYIYLTKPQKTLNEEQKDNLIKSNKIALYGMLDERYLKEYDITQDNIFEKINQIEDSTIIIDNMYTFKKNEKMSIYIVNGKLRNNVSLEKTSFKLMVESDMSNKTFKIILEDYLNSYVESIELGAELKFEIPEHIEKGTYNTFQYKSIDDETYLIDLFDEFQNNIVYDYETTYERLEKEYREKRFPNYQEFVEYANNNKRSNLFMELDGFMKTEYSDYIEYVLKADNGRKYIFRETAVMKYQIILDEYTIDLPAFIKKYDQATDQNKAGMNIEKFMTAINEQDYRYAYNCLATSFKQNNFPTLESFKEYVSNTFFKNNTTEYKNVSEEGKYYVYELNITDSNDSTNYIEKQFIVNLKDNREFELSFELE